MTRGIWLPSLLIAGLIRAPTTLANKIEHHGGKDYCETEAFNASCNADGIIIMTKAKYGRMQLSRCVKLDYGHVGCSADVLELADTRCSGRHKCQIRIPDALFARTKPCPDDLKPYLEATYKCLKVLRTFRLSCKNSNVMRPKSVHLNDPVGHIASEVAMETGCGRRQSPWVITVEPGQRVNMSLLDFGVLQRKNRALSAPGGLGGCQVLRAPCSSATVRSYTMLQVYATVHERLGTHVKNTSICGSFTRYRHVYMSTTNSVQVVMTSQQLEDASPFILEYESVGCPDVPLPEHTWLMRNGEDAVVGCNYTRQMWRLQCQRGSWVGAIGNCSTIKPNTLLEIKVNDFSLPYGISIIVIIIVALMIGIGVLFSGLICLKKQRETLCSQEDSSLGCPDDLYGPSLASRDELRYAEEDKYGAVRYVRGVAEYGMAGTDLQPCTPLLDKAAKPTLYGQLVHHPACSACQQQRGANSGGVYSALPTSLGLSAGTAPPDSDSSQYFVLDPEAVLAAQMGLHDSVLRESPYGVSLGATRQTAVSTNPDGRDATVSIINCCPECGLTRRPAPPGRVQLDNAENELKTSNDPPPSSSPPGPLPADPGLRSTDPS